jgi:ATP-dependent Clp protease, protease subunit
MSDEQIQFDPGGGGPSHYGIYYFNNEFSLQTVKDPISWILESNLSPKGTVDSLTLIISSYGGDLAAAFALVDVMRGSKIPIHTVGLGMVASAGLLVFIAGEKGHRSVTPNTSILSHQFSWGSYGKEHELLASQKQSDLTTKKMIAHYRKYTGLTEKVVRDKLLPAQDVWLSAQEAKELGLVDKVKELR